ncbi:hypothetical protein FGB62_211g017 [Gracilaria domingensis]|nr:hypothetical protein FGB62_211g017 [Gracilaria domingensis]
MLGNDEADSGARFPTRSPTASSSKWQKSAVLVKGQVGNKKPVHAKVLGAGEETLNKELEEVEMTSTKGAVQKVVVPVTKAVSAKRPIQVKVHRREEEVVDNEIIGDGIETPKSKGADESEDVLPEKESFHARQDGKGRKQRALRTCGISIPPPNGIVEADDEDCVLTQNGGSKNSPIGTGSGEDENGSRNVASRFPDFAGLVDEDFADVIAGNEEEAKKVQNGFHAGRRPSSSSSSSIIDLIGDEANPGRSAACANVVRNLTMMKDGNADSQEVDGSEDVVIPIDLEKFMREQESEIGAMHDDGVVGRAEIFGGRARGGAPCESSYAQKRKGADSRLGRRKRRKQERRDVNETSNVDTSPKQLWKSMVQETLGRSPDYFRSKNAMLRDLDIRVRKGSIGYPGLKISVANCPDLEEVYMLRFKTKELLHTRGSGSFSVFRSIVGQFVRWAIASGKLPLFDGWKRLALFRLLKEEHLVRCFVNYFIRIASFNTIASKCNVLRIMCQYASVRMADMEDRNQIARVEMYLGTAFNAAKGGARESTRKLQSAEERIKNQTIVSRKQIEKGVNVARSQLNGMIESFSATACKLSRRAAVKEMMQTKGLLDKWCINFLALIALTGGGQRPQAYARLQCPSDFTLDECIDEELRNPKGLFEMKTFREKTARALDVPNINFPRLIMPYVAFHVDLVRPMILRRRKLPLTTSFKRNRPLLLHSRTGVLLKSSHISRTIKTFMTSVHSSLTSVTAMTLRTSFATAMLHDYRRGKFTKDGQEMNEDKFLGLVAKQMNTSVEQLRGTYMASRSSDFKEVTAIMTKHFCMIMGEDSGDEDDGASESDDELSDSQHGTEKDSVEDESSDEDVEDEIGTGVGLFEDEEESQDED